jgi:tetratricopeptide (TPR) repeat protein
LLIVNPSSLKAAKETAWVEIRSPHFTVFSDAGEKKARRVTHDFEQFHAVIRQFIPSIEAGPSIPTIVFAAKDERTLRFLLPEYWEQKGRAHPSGIFVGGPEENYVSLRLDMEDDYRYHVVYHEYVHLLMRLNYPPLPTWLSEGLAECFGFTVISDDSSGVGRASPMLLEIFKDQQPLSIAELFAVDQDSPYYREESKTPIFYAESWALTHLLLLGDKTAHSQKLWKLLDLIRNNVPIDTAIAQSLGDLKELERRLFEYIRQPGFYSFEVKTPSVQDPKEYPARAVPPLEIQIIQGDFFVSTQRWTEAKKMLDSALAEDPDNPKALTSLGVFYARQNRQEEARKYFVAAADAGSVSCITHYYVGVEAAQMREYEKAEASFRRAIDLNSRFAPAYSGLAGILAMKEETAKTALKFALQAVEMEPGVLSHQLNLANVLMRLKNVDLAIKYGERVEAAAESIRDREEAKRFLSMARRYRDDLKEMDRMNGDIWRRRQPGNNQPKTNESQLEPDGASIGQREARQKAFEEAEREHQRILKEKSETFEGRDNAERGYLKQVELARANGTATLEGVVSEVNCFNPAGIELTIEADGSLHKLHIADYFNIRFQAIGFKPDSELKPCSDLAGRKVTATFIATPGAAYAGEIQSLGIYKK